MIDTPELSIVIPLYSEGEHLKETLAIIQREVESLGLVFELILVDDGSPDNTWSIIEEASKKNMALKAILLSRNFGKESALCAGLEYAKGSAVIVMDGDLQHPPSLIPQMVRIWRDTGVDIVEAIKQDRGEESILGKLGARLFYFMMNKLAGFNMSGASDFKLVSRRALNAWLKIGENNLFFRGTIAWLGFKHAKVEFNVPRRAGGVSGWSIFHLLRLALRSITAFSTIPLQIITALGFLFLIFAVYLTGLYTFNKLTGVNVDNFATLVILVSILGSALMISLGIIGQYLANIYEEVKGRPRYIIHEQLNIINDFPKRS